MALRAGGRYGKGTMVQDDQRNGKCQHSMWHPGALRRVQNPEFMMDLRGLQLPETVCKSVCVCVCDKEPMRACNHVHLCPGLSSGSVPTLLPPTKAQNHFDSPPWDLTLRVPVWAGLSASFCPHTPFSTAGTGILGKAPDIMSCSCMGLPSFPFLVALRSAPCSMDSKTPDHPALLSFPRPFALHSLLQLQQTPWVPHLGGPTVQVAWHYRASQDRPRHPDSWSP